MTGATLTLVIPRGANFTLTSGANISAWGSPFSNYTWNSPVITPTVSGLTWTVPLGDLVANTGVVVEFTGTVPAGTVLSENSVATAHVVVAYVPGTGTCPMAARTFRNTPGCSRTPPVEAESPRVAE